MIRNRLVSRTSLEEIRSGFRAKYVPLAISTWLLLMLLMVVPSSFAQGSSNISGYVRDTSGAALPGASVTAMMTEQSTTRTTHADSQGFYNFVALPAGHYTIKFDASGFRGEVHSNIELTVSQNARADAQLTIGTVQSEVEVTGAVPLVDTTSNTLSGLVDDRRVVDLPLNGRNIMSLAAILPGVTNVSAPETMGDARSGPEMNVNGSLPNSTIYTFDGAYFNNPSRNTGLNLPPPDAIAQFRMLTSNFPSEYGHSSGAQVEVVSRAGTDSIHGSAWEFLRNDAFNAKDYFADRRQSQKKNQYGAAIGGPILKRRAFFFASYQGLSDHVEAESVQAVVPSASERSGDFTGLATLKNPLDPLTKLPLTDANGTPCVIGQKITPGCISPVAVNLLKFVPAGDPTTGTVTSLAPSPVSNHTGMIRLDWNQSQKNLIYGHYYQDNTSYTSPFSGYAGGNIPAYVGQSTTVKTQDGVINDVYTFSSSLINQAVFSVLNTTTHEEDSPSIPYTSLGINLPQYAPFGAVVVNVGDNFILDSGQGINFSGLNYQIADKLSWTKGRHSFRFGFETLKLHFYQSFMATPSFTFTGVRSNDPVADFILGAYDTTNVNFGLRQNDDYTTYNSFYAQDQLRLNPRLVLTYGLRYEPFLQWKDGQGKLDSFVPGAQSTIDPTAPPGIVFPGDKGISKGIAPANLSNVAPRVGFAWDVTGDGKTSVRGGYGVFYNSINANEVAQENPPYAGTLNAYDGDVANPFTSTGQANPPLTPSGKFGCTQITTYPFYSCSLFPLPVSGMLAISTKLRLPYYQQFSLSVQKQVTPTTMVEVSYVGNTGRQIHGRVPNNPARFITDPITGAPPSKDNVNDRVLYEPGIMSPTNTTMTNFGHSSYNALQVQGTKRFGKGSTILANYTWAKSLDMNSTNNANPRLPNPFDVQKGYGPSNVDRKHSFVVSWLYVVPIHFHNSVTNSVLGGWTLTAIHTVASGYPITFLAGQDVAVDGTGGPQYAQLAPNASARTIRISHPDRASMVARFFNTDAFVAPNSEALGTYGNSSKGMITGPAYANTDASLLKDFRLPESMKLQFRLESFNTFNQVNFANPNSTVNSGPAGFGRIQSTVAQTGRQLQLALKLLW